MKRRLAIVLACAILASCASNVGVTVTSSASTAPTTSSAYVASQSAGVLWLTAALLAAAWYGGDGVSYGPGYGYGASIPRWSIWAPPLDDARRVNEQSCTSPIEDSGANLRCR